MKKALVVAVGLVLAGCQSVPEKNAVAPAAAAPAAQAEPQVQAPVQPVAQEVEPVAAPVNTAPAEPQVVAAVATEPAAPVKVTSNEPPKPASSSAMAMDPRMDKVVKLIYSSSGAKQVMESDSPKALEYHEKAKALYRQATEATEKSEASRLLNDAVKAMYTAIRSASPEKVLASKKKADFDKLHRSVDTFVEQHERISQEKGANGEGKALREQVRVLVVEAENLFAQGRSDDAQHLLRESFEMLRDSIETMRGGDTLVRSLNFATKKDEYDYELERYKSQLLLVDVLLESKRKSSAYVAKQVDRFVEVAEGDRAKAEAAAGGGDHETAIKHLEDARKQIVRALRSGGIYVPG
ncbi:hypothetical protein [Motiliproteus sediminis]|uniref:hypothetical protein n=1 Tax=Motiliproteus sediminis TaxID=1468178 RepID=UPI001AEFCDCD|nr:hypothetical protein [Motiliproteus sediminis]